MKKHLKKLSLILMLIPFMFISTIESIGAVPPFPDIEAFNQVRTMMNLIDNRLDFLYDQDSYCYFFTSPNARDLPQGKNHEWIFMIFPKEDLYNLDGKCVVTYEMDLNEERNVYGVRIREDVAPNKKYKMIKTGGRGDTVVEFSSYPGQFLMLHDPKSGGQRALGFFSGSIYAPGQALHGLKNPWEYLINPQSKGPSNTGDFPVSAPITRLNQLKMILDEQYPNHDYIIYYNKYGGQSQLRFNVFPKNSSCKLLFYNDYLDSTTENVTDGYRVSPSCSSSFKNYYIYTPERTSPYTSVRLNTIGSLFFYIPSMPAVPLTLDKVNYAYPYGTGVNLEGSGYSDQSRYNVLMDTSLILEGGRFNGKYERPAEPKEAWAQSPTPVTPNNPDYYKIPHEKGSDELNSFFGGFSTNFGGLTGVITAPLVLVGNLASNSCVPLPVPLPYTNKTFSLPCMTQIYQTNFGGVYNIYKLIVSGVISYGILMNILSKVKGFKEPTSSKIDTVDL